MFLAKQGDKVIGFTHIRRTRRGVFIDQSYTRHTYRRQGVFSKMLDVVIEFARNKAILADVDPDRPHYETLARKGFHIRDATDYGNARIVKRGTK